MGFIFLGYFVTFVLVATGRKGPAYAGFAVSTALSIGMYFYHATSSLGLNF